MLRSALRNTNSINCLFSLFFISLTPFECHLRSSTSVFLWKEESVMHYIHNVKLEVDWTSRVALLIVCHQLALELLWQLYKDKVWILSFRIVRKSRQIKHCLKGGAPSQRPQMIDKLEWPTRLYELNPPYANEMSTDNAEQFVLLEIPKKERLHQLPPHELNPHSANETANEISTDSSCHRCC